MKLGEAADGSDLAMRPNAPIFKHWNNRPAWAFRASALLFIAAHVIAVLLLARGIYNYGFALWIMGMFYERLVHPHLAHYFLEMMD